MNRDQWAPTSKEKAAGRIGVLEARLALLGPAVDGEPPATTARRLELEVELEVARAARGDQLSLL